MDVTFFNSASEFRAWLEEHHQSVGEVWVGFHKKGTGEPGIAYAEALDEALCFGWIDGVRKSLGAAAYVIRFSPRKPHSTWSLVNIRRVEELSKLGRMHPSGLKAFEERSRERSGRYSYEARTRELDAAYEEEFRAHRIAWDFFQAQPPSYRRSANWWVMSARQEETRQRRLAALIEASEKGQRLAHLTGPSSRRKA